MFWLQSTITATEEHESQVLQVECGLEFSQPAGEQHHCVVVVQCLLLTIFNMLSGYNLLLQPQNNMKVKSSRMNVAWNALCQQVNNRNMIQVHEEL